MSWQFNEQMGLWIHSSGRTDRSPKDKMPAEINTRTRNTDWADHYWGYLLKGLESVSNMTVDAASRGPISEETKRRISLVIKELQQIK